MLNIKSARAVIGERTVPWPLSSLVREGRRALTFISLARRSARTVKNLRRDEKRGLLVDCGSNVGQGFDIFRRHYTSDCFDYELFEPNPYCFDILQKKVGNLPDCRIVLHRKAVGTRAGFAKFFGLSEAEGGQLSEGGSLVREHNAVFYEAREAGALEVETLSFADYLKSKSESYDTIIVKMDIEGGEYDVIQDLLDRNLCGKIDTMYLEFHALTLSDRLWKQREALEGELALGIRASGCSLVLWF